MLSSLDGKYTANSHECVFYSWLLLSMVFFFEISSGWGKFYVFFGRPWQAQRWWNSQWWSCVCPTASPGGTWRQQQRWIWGTLWATPLQLGSELTVGKSFAGKKAAVFCQAWIEILKKLLPFSDLITLNCDNFAWKWLMQGSMWCCYVLIWEKKLFTCRLEVVQKVSDGMCVWLVWSLEIFTFPEHDTHCCRE